MSQSETIQPGAFPLLTVALRFENDVVLARQRARLVAEELGFESQDQTRIATAASELARNAFRYADGGRVEYLVDLSPRPSLRLRVSDTGPGIADLDAVLAGRYVSTTGMGLGLIGVRRLMDNFDIVSVPGSTVVVVEKRLPRGAPTLTTERLHAVSEAIGRQSSANPFEEVQRQNQELLLALEEVGRRTAELDALNEELESTNRGVVALYAELEERAAVLRRSDEAKSRFLSSLSHELRTPLNSVIALSGLLLDHTDGPLLEEQETQVKHVRRSAAVLLHLVNELLDLAKIESGSTDVRIDRFSVDELFTALRGMMRPLLTRPDVALSFDAGGGIPELETDEARLSQVLRNFVSNALKFTEYGAVTVSATYDPDADTVTFAIADTGIGIAETDQMRIFDEFVQIEGVLQTPVKGTGLGLPISKRLAEVLGGRVDLQSEVGRGSTFTVTIPRVYRGAGIPGDSDDAKPENAILVVDDDETQRYLVRRTAEQRGLAVEEAADGPSGLARARELQPRLIVLDLGLPGMDGYTILHELKSDAATAAIPVVIFTSATVETDDPRLAAAQAVIAKGEYSRELLAAAISRAIVANGDGG